MCACQCVLLPALVCVLPWHAVCWQENKHAVCSSNDSQINRSWKMGQWDHPTIFLWLFESLSFHPAQLLAYAALTHALNLSNAELFKWAVCPCVHGVTWIQLAFHLKTFDIWKPRHLFFLFCFVCQLTLLVHRHTDVCMMICGLQSHLSLYHRLLFVIDGGVFSCNNFLYHCKSLWHAPTGAKQPIRMTYG